MSVEDRERDTWDDWCDSAFHDGYGEIFPDIAGAYPPVIFSDQLLWEGDALGTCASYDGVLDDGEGWLCLLFSPRSGNSGNNSVATRLMCHGLAHYRCFAWDPGPGAG